MISVCSHFYPFAGHLFGCLSIFLSDILFTQHSGHFTVSGNSHNRFDRKIGIMSKMSGKIVCTKLIFRIQSFFQKIIGPSGQYLPVFGSIIRISFLLSDSGSQNQHISGLFHRHVSTVSLAVSQRIGPHIVSGKRFTPFSAFTVFENEIHQAFSQFDIVF